MKYNFPQKLFITGTDTGIGKTVVSAMLTRGLKATYWKPVQSGLQDETDTEAVQRISGLPSTHFKPETYKLNQPLSPHASAQIDGVKIDMDAFQIPEYDTEHLIIEGAGGLMVPLNDESMMIDLIERLKVPALVVARSSLGTLNHTFLTLEALRERAIPILGVVMNGPKNESNRKAIEFYGTTTVLAEIEPVEKINPEIIQQMFNHFFSNKID